MVITMAKLYAWRTQATHGARKLPGTISNLSKDIVKRQMLNLTLVCEDEKHLKRLWKVGRWVCDRSVKHTDQYQLNFKLESKYAISEAIFISLVYGILFLINTCTNFFINIKFQFHHFHNFLKHFPFLIYRLTETKRLGQPPSGFANVHHVGR